MKKILIISAIAVLLNLVGLSYESPYPYIWGNTCDAEASEHYKGWCYGITGARGYPLGYLPDQSDSGFDVDEINRHDTFNGRNFFLNFVFYYMAISALALYTQKTKREIKFFTSYNSAYAAMFPMVNPAQILRW